MVSPGSASASLLAAVALLPRVAAGEFFNQLAIVRRIKHLEIDLRVERAQAADFAILARDKRLTQRCQLNVEVVLWQVKIGREKTRRRARRVPLEGEAARLVLPLDMIEAQDARELGFRFVGEAHRLR